MTTNGNETRSLKLCLLLLDLPERFREKINQLQDLAISRACR